MADKGWSSSSGVKRRVNNSLPQTVLYCETSAKDSEFGRILWDSSGLCPVAGFGVNDIDPSCLITTVTTTFFVNTE